MGERRNKEEDVEGGWGKVVDAGIRDGDEVVGGGGEEVHGGEEETGRDEGEIEERLDGDLGGREVGEGCGGVTEKALDADVQACQQSESQEGGTQQVDGTLEKDKQALQKAASVTPSQKQVCADPSFRDESASASSSDAPGIAKGAEALLLFKYGLHVVARDALTNIPAWLACKFCVRFGCLTYPREYVKLYRVPFDKSLLEMHVVREHRRAWEEFRDAPHEARVAFFEHVLMPDVDALKGLVERGEGWDCWRERLGREGNVDGRMREGQCSPLGPVQNECGSPPGWLRDPLRFERPPPRFEGPPPRFEGPPPRLEGMPVHFERPLPRFEGPPPRFEGPPPRFDAPPPRFDGPPPRPPPLFEGPPPLFEGPPPPYEGPPSHGGGLPLPFAGPPPRYEGPLSYCLTPPQPPEGMRPRVNIGPPPPGIPPMHYELAPRNEVEGACGPFAGGGEGRHSLFYQEAELQGMLLMFGLMVVHRDPITNEATWVACKFCPNFGCQKKKKKRGGGKRGAGVERNYIMAFSSPFRAEDIRRHMTRGHGKEFAKYRQGNAEQRRCFFDENLVPPRLLLEERIVECLRRKYKNVVRQARREGWSSQDLTRELLSREAREREMDRRFFLERENKKRRRNWDEDGGRKVCLQGENGGLGANGDVPDVEFYLQRSQVRPPRQVAPISPEVEIVECRDDNGVQGGPGNADDIVIVLSDDDDSESESVAVG